MLEVYPNSTLTTLVAWGISVSQPILNSLISQMTAAEEQGQILGIASSCSALARIAGPTWAGVSFIKFGSSAPFLSGTLVMVVALTLSLRVTKSASEPKTERVA
ncbi:hypothetical protein [Nostoc sp.]|uniref:hypothetical protein n=1 Tax=Nostoc sp. TaxID=1180 RepID=UPI002FF87AF4